MKNTLIQLLIALVLVAPITTSTAVAGFGTTGNDLYESCKQFTAGDKPPKDTMEAVNIGGCVAYVSSVMYLRENLGMCIPKGVTLLQGIKVILKFMDNHPEALNQPFPAIVYWGLNEAFPCHKQQ